MAVETVDGDSKYSEKPVPNGSFGGGNYDDDSPNFSDPEDFVDDVSDEEILADVLRTKPRLDTNLETAVVVDNIPVVGQDKLDKLKTIIRKLVEKYGKVLNEYFPFEDGQTKGYAYFELDDKDAAKEAVKGLTGHRLDKTHTFVVNLLTDIEKFSNVSDDWKPPEKLVYPDVGNLRYWLQEEHCHDQYFVIYGDFTAVFLNETIQPKVIQERKNWTEAIAQWSPLGTYIATFHPARGIALWGGEKFKQINRYSHAGVENIEFSPCERFLVTFSAVTRDPNDLNNIKIWDIRSGIMKRGFSASAPKLTWPLIKFNHDGLFFARMTPDTLSVFETATFGLMDKRSIKIPTIADFSWSPTDNIIAYWTPETENSPARVILIEIPSRDEIRSLNIYSVVDNRMVWQKNGDYLCVNAERYNKKTKKDKETIFAGKYHSFYIFRMREKNVPMDTVELKEYGHSSFSWEPSGMKFVVLSCPQGNTASVTATFYKLTKDGKVEQIMSLPKRTANAAFWSPAGQHVVLAQTEGSLAGNLEFYDTNDLNHMLSRQEHHKMTDVDWDPTGRFVITTASAWGKSSKDPTESGFQIFSAMGRQLFKSAFGNSHVFMVCWRPRPQTLLPKQHMEEIKKKMKQYSLMFEQQDNLHRRQVSKELLEKHRGQKEVFQVIRDRNDVRVARQKRDRIELRGGIDTDDFLNNVQAYEEEIVEFLLSTKEELCQD